MCKGDWGGAIGWVAVATTESESVGGLVWRTRTRGSQPRKPLERMVTFFTERARRYANPCGAYSTLSISVSGCAAVAMGRWEYETTPADSVLVRPTGLIGGVAEIFARERKTLFRCKESPEVHEEPQLPVTV